MVRGSEDENEDEANKNCHYYFGGRGNAIKPAVKGAEWDNG